MLLCVLAYLGSAAHFALVRHSFCVEHGESVHVDEVPSQASSAQVERSFADSRVACASQLARLSHGAEAHCTHHFHRRELQPPPAAGVSSVEAPPESRGVLSAAILFPEPIARLRLAPKSSPPRA